MEHGPFVVSIAVDADQPTGNLLELTGGFPNTENDTLGKVEVYGLSIGGVQKVANADYVVSIAPHTRNTSFDRQISITEINSHTNGAYVILLNSKTGTYYIAPNESGLPVKIQLAVYRDTPAEHEPAKGINPSDLSVETQLQMAALLLQTGTPQQKLEIEEFLKKLFKEPTPLEATNYPTYKMTIRCDKDGVNSTSAGFTAGRYPSEKHVNAVIRALGEQALELLSGLPKDMLESKTSSQMHTLIREPVFSSYVIESQQDALQFATHRHYKGGLYRELGVGHHSEDKDADGKPIKMVIYEHLYPHERGLWVRPAELFYGYLEDGLQRRFTPLFFDIDEVKSDPTL
jgi:hypothetical protein